jgi:DNA-binding NarL/FixJ family response regulator
MSHCIALVGHCGVDGPRLQREIRAQLADCEVLRINSTEDLARCDADLLLVNREPVGFTEGGLALIRQLRERNPDCKVMLVSDYPEAQEQAVKAGALPGFGKAQFGDPSLVETVRKALGT